MVVMHTSDVHMLL